MIQELCASVEERYDEFVSGTNGLEALPAQVVLLALVSKRLALDGMPLGASLRTVARAWGIDLAQMQVVDSRGEALVEHSTPPTIH